MPSVYLFRIDGAKDNDAFFEGARAKACHVYAGADFRAGACGWIPDFVRVVLDETPSSCRLTLIELEASEPAAIISCRKYLPEKSQTIIQAFLEYLDRLIRLCRSSADPREAEFAKLKETLHQHRQITITTAGALRSSEHFVEELPLIDQPDPTAHRPYVQAEVELNERVFGGLLRLSQKEAKGLARCVKILDAVIRHADHSGGTIHSWIGGRTQPLKRLLTESNGHHAALSAFLLQRDNRGITFDFDKVLSDLVEIWSAARGAQLDRELTRGLVSRYFPVALEIAPQEQMVVVFDKARTFVADSHLTNG
jgi:hypothetical protein